MTSWSLFEWINFMVVQLEFPDRSSDTPYPFDAGSGRVKLCLVSKVSGFIVANIIKTSNTLNL